MQSQLAHLLERWRSLGGNALQRRQRADRIPRLVTRIYEVVQELEELFPGRRFTPDGHLVGGIGEVLADQYYGIDLLPASFPGHTGRTDDGKLVQIKATQRGKIGLRSESEMLLVVQLSPGRQLPRRSSMGRGVLHGRPPALRRRTASAVSLFRSSHDSWRQCQRSNGYREPTAREGVSESTPVVAWLAAIRSTVRVRRRARPLSPRLLSLVLGDLSLDGLGSGRVGGTVGSQRQRSMARTRYPRGIAESCGSAIQSGSVPDRSSVGEWYSFSDRSDEVRGVDSSPSFLRQSSSLKAISSALVREPAPW